MVVIKFVCMKTIFLFCFRLHNERIYYVSEKIMRLASTIKKDNLVSFGKYFFLEQFGRGGGGVADLIIFETKPGTLLYCIFSFEEKKQKEQFLNQTFL